MTTAYNTVHRDFAGHFAGVAGWHVFGWSLAASHAAADAERTGGVPDWRGDRDRSGAKANLC